MGLIFNKFIFLTSIMSLKKSLREDFFFAVTLFIIVFKKYAEQKDIDYWPTQYHHEHCHPHAKYEVFPVL
jgi:hypothetical protein